MDVWIVLFGVFAIFLPALMLPGPDFIAVVRTSMARGQAAGLMTVLGVTTAQGLYATLSLVGLSAILIEYQWLAIAIRILGGGYLVYLGIRLLFTRPRETPPDGGAEPGGGSGFVFGFLVTLTNPKAVVLFASIFATAVTAQTPGWLMALIVGLVVLACLVWYSAVCLFMSAGPVIGRLKRAGHWIERVAGVCFIAIGGRILADARNPVTP